MLTIDFEENSEKNSEENSEENSQNNEQEKECIVIHCIKTYGRTATIRHLVHLVSLHCGLEKEEKKQILEMFSCKKIPICCRTWDDSFESDIAFSFWGYFKSSQARDQLLKLLVYTLDPKMYSVAETKKNFMEGILIVKLDRLYISRELFEEWLDIFFSKLRMSAGVIVFKKYLDEQMLTSIERLQNSTTIRSNLNSYWNKDFRLLIQEKLKAKKEQDFVMAMTGISFTPDEFFNVFRMRGGYFRGSAFAGSYTGGAMSRNNQNTLSSDAIDRPRSAITLPEVLIHTQRAQQNQPYLASLSIDNFNYRLLTH
jgi:hypothetical protein